MACGRAVICSATGGAGELVTDGYNALTHPPGDPAALAARITELAKSQERREGLGRVARAEAERRFSLNRLAGEVIQLYRHVTEQLSAGKQAQLVASR
jgi:glycosyltransferase involved in cell wall biosynthesis